MPGRRRGFGANAVRAQRGETKGAKSSIRIVQRTIQHFWLVAPSLIGVQSELPPRFAARRFPHSEAQTRPFPRHSLSFDFASWICACVNSALASIRPMVLLARLRLRQ